MELNEELIQGTAAVLHYVVTNEKVKLTWGRLKRLEDRERAAKGLKVDSYRATWLREMRDDVIRALIASSKQFREKYPHDRISVRDYLDVLKNIEYQFQERITKQR